MKFISRFIKKYFGHFAYFYKHLRHRIFIAIALTFSVGLFDGLGLTMFLPLLKLAGGEKEVTGEGMGGMEKIVEAFNYIGVPLKLYTVLGIILFFFILKGIAIFFRNYYNVVVSLFFNKNLRFRNLDGLTNFKYKAFVTSDSGRIQNTMSGEVGRVMNGYTSYFNTMQNWIMMLVYLGMAFVTNPQFALLVICGGALSNLAYKQIYKKTKEASVRISAGGHSFQGQLIQIVANFKYLKATGFLKDYGEKLKVSVDFILTQQRRIGILNSILGAVKEPINVAVVMLVIFIQVRFFGSEMGAIILSLLFFYRALNYIMALQSSWNGYLSSSGAIANMTEFAENLTSEKESYGKETLVSFENHILVDEIDFFYNKTQILKKLSLNIKKNTTIAFVGESGSGKTTLINLLAGLMPADRGSISIDSKPYSEMDIRTVQKRIGYITQDPVIFSDTIYDNVTRWAERTEETVQRFWNALDQAAISDFVKTLPKQENSELGNNGIQLSGGQKQRLSIARELYKDIDILIMDEATSALDSETEKAIQENIDSLKGKYTIIIVAHRLSTIRNADTIFLLKKGKLEASGNYESLVDQSSAFRRMTELQDL